MNGRVRANGKQNSKRPPTEGGINGGRPTGQRRSASASLTASETKSTSSAFEAVHDGTESMKLPAFLAETDRFAGRHLGSGPKDIEKMLKTLGVKSLADLVDETIPADIRLEKTLDVPLGQGESAALGWLKKIMAKNQVFRSFIGAGYYGCLTPTVIQRNILENPGWYTQYTPYQAEIAQGRLEALLNYQTVICDLTSLPISNASLLDEATAAAEAMAMARASHRGKRSVFFAADDCHPQTLAVLETRAKPLGIDLRIASPDGFNFDDESLFGALFQYPATDGCIRDYRAIVKRLQAVGAVPICAADLLAITLLVPPGDVGFEIAIGSTQRFGVPMGFGGPHAAYVSCHERFRRQLPGRLVGVSKDRNGKAAYRLALQTREQHIRRDRATSNICTAQVLLAIMASMFAVYHGPEGLTRIAKRVRGLTRIVREGLKKLGYAVNAGPVFDTLRVSLSPADAKRIEKAALGRRMNLRKYDDGLGMSFDECTTIQDVENVFAVFEKDGETASVFEISQLSSIADEYGDAAKRESEFLQAPVFHNYRTEHELLRYLHRLQAKDLSLTTSMIPLGSCTMKLNAISEMTPVSWPEVAHLHPFAPQDQTEGYDEMLGLLQDWLASVTGFAAVSLQPNAGAQGEYAGLLAIRAYHEDRGEPHRSVCLIPVSAHGTNPASAVMAGFRVVAVACDANGNIDVADLKKKAEEHKQNLGAIMVTYPSTHGVFETSIREICQVVHDNGGQVYLDGANMNAQVGLCRPGDYGADVCHLNLHKTFCIPHGGGGPGMGPIGVAAQLAPFLSGHPERPSGEKAMGPVSAAPFGSPSILPISWMYIAMMGRDGLTRATEMAILNANYMAKRLEGAFSILYRGPGGRVAHEFILDMRPFKKSAGVEVDDIAKRLMDYGFHAPTMSFPVPGTLMIEPTESESRAELDRFCDAMLMIRDEIRDIEQGKVAIDESALRLAPHTALDMASDWQRPYSRETAAFPAPWLTSHKYWPAVGRIDNAFGDRNLICTCPSVEEMSREP